VALDSLAPLVRSGFLLLYLSLAIAHVRVTLPLWKNDLLLWRWAYVTHPHSALARYNYLASAIREGELELARQALDELGEPLSYPMMSLKGMYLISLGRYQEAVDQLEAAIAPLPLYHERPPQERRANCPEESRHAPENKGLCRDSNAKRDYAASRDLKTWWIYQSVYTNLGQAYLGLKDYKMALEQARIALFYRPRYPSAWMVKSLAGYGLGNWREAESTFATALDFSPEFLRPMIRSQRKNFLIQLCRDLTLQTPIPQPARGGGGGESVACAAEAPPGREGCEGIRQDMESEGDVCERWHQERHGQATVLGIDHPFAQHTEWTTVFCM